LNPTQPAGSTHQVQGSAQRKLLPKLDRLQVKHQRHKGDEQERPGGQDGAEVGPRAVEVQPLQVQRDAPPEDGVLEGEEHLEVALGPPAPLAKHIAQLLGGLTQCEVLGQVPRP